MFFSVEFTYFSMWCKKEVNDFASEKMCLWNIAVHADIHNLVFEMH